MGLSGLPVGGCAGPALLCPCGVLRRMCAYHSSHGGGEHRWGPANSAQPWGHRAFEPLSL